MTTIHDVGLPVPPQPPGPQGARSTKATINGSLAPIPDCWIKVPTGDAGTGEGGVTIPMRSLPDISDTKSAVYNQEPIIGRSFPLYTFSHSSDRNISFQVHFYCVDEGDADQNLR